jgi:hypothetical protein
MGTYLVNGIVQDIIIEKNQIKYEAITIDKITEELKNIVDIDCYNYKEDKTAYYWKIKPKILENNLSKFLEQQFEMYGLQDNDVIEIIAKLKKTKSGEDIIDLAATKSLVHFQLIKNIIDYITIKKDTGFKTAIEVDYHLISYFIDGKIIMECYGNILRYFENNIRKQRDKYPIVDCIKVMITC